ncbi:fumarylacetoacetate hydrolase family protein [Gordonia sp. NB41Y]|uniref:fumarylacetoacetate hydrolase family protein n=1 Tax=Gordonia sp. NB41Y TaxID=875808 RepID=UPI0002BDC1C6|nr:fumarylacetoacetate hydrolase family protein [Gordonia sp. NB41Y]WLP88441.1 fumarylacetoacetate hydrolase family protein [Gordonia sp. NB41Y]
MTRFGNLDGRTVIVGESGVVDLETASSGRFTHTPAALYEHWVEITRWLAATELPDAVPVSASSRWGSPSPQPRQIIAIGVNSQTKLEQFGLSEPDGIGFISRLPSSVTGPFDAITLTSDQVVIETELALVIGRYTRHCSPEDALDHLAGVTVAGDLADIAGFVRIPARPASEGTVANRILDAAPLYFNPAKSLPGFTPLGPYLVTLDELGPLNDLQITLRIDQDLVQRGTPTDFVHSIVSLISGLSQQIPLLPGDVILTGSPGQLENHPLSPLNVGVVAELSIPGVGAQRHEFTQ